jgi:hypothetical protein
MPGSDRFTVVWGQANTDAVDEGMNGVQPYRSNPNDNTAKDAPTFNDM